MASRRRRDSGDRLRLRQSQDCRVDQRVDGIVITGGSQCGIPMQRPVQIDVLQVVSARFGTVEQQLFQARLVSHGESLFADPFQQWLEFIQ